MKSTQLPATATDGAGRQWRFQVREATPLSLEVLWPDDAAPAPLGTTFSNLEVAHPSRAVALGRCHLEPSGTHLRLVFLDEVFDVSALFAQGHVTNVLHFLNELPLVLAQREQIDPRFRGFVADVHYDLSVFKKFLDEQDRLVAREPAPVAQAAQRVLLQRAGRQFYDSLDKMLDELSATVAGYAPEQHERHGYYLRQQLWPFLMASAFMARTNLKPRGYAGDAVMMQMIYDNHYEGEWVFNKLLHKHPVEHAAAQAVRNRRVLVPLMLHEVRRAWPEPRLRVLSVACGPARELEEICRDAATASQLELTLLDQDEDALAAARATVAAVELRVGAPLQAQTVNASVRTLLKERDLAARFGRFGFVYSMGMFDYLTPPVARAVLARLYELLAPGGALVVGNYHVDNPSRFYMAYWLDWTLYYRTDDEMLALAAGLPGANVSLQRDATGAQMFLRVEKRA